MRLHALSRWLAAKTTSVALEIATPRSCIASTASDVFPAEGQRGAAGRQQQEMRVLYLRPAPLPATARGACSAETSRLPVPVDTPRRKVPKSQLLAMRFAPSWFESATAPQGAAGLPALSIMEPAPA